VAEEAPAEDRKTRKALKLAFLRMYRVFDT